MTQELGRDVAFRALMSKAKGGLYSSAQLVLLAVDKDKSMLAKTTTADAGATLLHKASEGGSFELVNGLLDRLPAACLCWKDDQERDPLFIACMRGQRDVASLLLTRGADPNTRSKQLTAIGRAASCGYHDVCLLLISHSAGLMAPMPNGSKRSAYSLYGDAMVPPLSAAECSSAGAVEGLARGPAPEPGVASPLAADECDRGLRADAAARGRAVRSAASAAAAPYVVWLGQGLFSAHRSGGCGSGCG